MRGRCGIVLSFVRFVMAVGVVVVASGCSEDQPSPAPEGMVLIPAGEFAMGSDEVDSGGLQEEFGFREPMYLDEHPRHRRDVEAFYIDQYEVRNSDYRRFVVETGIAEPQIWIQNGYNVSDDRLRSFELETLRWVATEYFRVDQDTTQMDQEQLMVELGEIQRQRDVLPVTSVNWYDASSYCKWLGKRLPGEAEWEKAARGPQGFAYPWGDEWDIAKSNTGDLRESEEILAAVGSFPGDVSVFGVYDMGGNVSEWVSDWYAPYAGAEYQSPYYGDIHKVIKGGGAGVGHYALSYFFRAARRGQADPSAVSTDVGFRCASAATKR